MNCTICGKKIIDDNDIYYRDGDEICYDCMDNLDGYVDLNNIFHYWDELIHIDGGFLYIDGWDDIGDYYHEEFFMGVFGNSKENTKMIENMVEIILSIIQKRNNFSFEDVSTTIYEDYKQHIIKLVEKYIDLAKK